MNKKFEFDFLPTGVSLFFSALIILQINPSLHHFLQQYAWQNNPDFLKHHLDYAGGFAEYVSLFFSGFLITNILGSILILALIAVSTFLLKKILDSINKELVTTGIFVALFPLMIVSFFVDYLFYFSVLVNVVIVLAFLFLQTSFSGRRKLKSVLILPLSILIYYICGGGYFLMFMVSSAMLALSDGGKVIWHRFFICIVLAITVPFFFYYVFFTDSLEQAYFRIFPDVAPMLRYSHKTLIVPLLSVVPFFIFISVFGSRIKFLKIRLANKISMLVSVVLLVSGSYFAVWYFVFDEREKQKAEIEYYAATENWKKVTELAGLIEKYDRMVNFQFNRAICHEGIMLEKLFDYPQLLGTQGLFLDKPFVSEVALPNSDLYFELGNIDESQRYAYEAQTLMHFSPRVLNRLAINNVILENFAGAKTFKKVIAENPFEKGRFKKIFELIDNPDSAPKNPLVAEKRKMMNKPAGIFLTPREKLIDLLNKNPENKMAFEYLIAFDLMEHDLASFSKHMDYFPAFKYSKLPGVIQEAVVLFHSQRPDNEFLSGFRISDDVSRRFSEFVKNIQSANGDKQKARVAAEKFKNTYGHYVLFSSPLVTKIQVETRPSEANY